MMIPQNSLHTFPLRPHPHLYEINAWAWLEELSRKNERPLTLGDIPDEEWDQLRRFGFDLVWLMGVWERSPESRRIFQINPSLHAEYDRVLPGWKSSDIVGSPYAVRLYRPDPRIGTWADLDRAREKLHARGMGLLLDFVPNHTALDHPWVREHPEFFIQGTEADYRRDPAAFFPVESARGKKLFLARGRDPYFPPWSDVAQVNYFEPAAGASMRGILREIARHCDGVRCDMAMLVLNDVFAKTWGGLLGTRLPPPEEFWTDAFAAVPEFIWLAEVYWGMERRLQDLGFTFTYDKAFYDQLLASKPAELRERLAADLTFQSRSARFLENHDEARSASVFGAERLQAAGTLLATAPGMRFFHQGQLEGRTIHLPIALARAREEPPDPQTSEFYRKILALAHADILHAGEWKLLRVLPQTDATAGNLIAYRWRLAGEYRLIVVNLAAGTSQGNVELTGDFPATNNYVFEDRLNGQTYPWKGCDIATRGLYARLEGFRAHLFDVHPA